MSPKKLSCGTIIVNEYCEILMGRVTMSKPARWDLPKGVIDKNELPIDAAVRECKEEFGILLDTGKMSEIGLIPYNNDKNLHLFITYMSKNDVDMDSLTCTSHFINHYTKKEVAEVDGYSWIPLSDVHDNCCGSMTRALTSLYDRIDQESKYGEYR